jgi:hypothetical protein
MIRRKLSEGEGRSGRRTLSEAAWVDQLGMDLVGLVGRRLEKDGVVKSRHDGRTYDNLSFILVDALRTPIVARQVLDMLLPVVREKRVELHGVD